MSIEWNKSFGRREEEEEEEEIQTLIIRIKRGAKEELSKELFK